MNLNELNHDLERIFEEEKVIDSFSKTRVLNFSSKKKKSTKRFFFPIAALLALLLISVNFIPFETTDPANKIGVTEVQEKNIKALQLKINSLEYIFEDQLELFNLMLEQLPENYFEQLADELVSYSLNLNDFPYNGLNNIATAGEFTFTVGEMYSEVFTFSDNPKLAELYNKMISREELTHIRLLTEHALEPISSAGGLSNGYGYRGENASDLKIVNDKIIFELSDYLKEKLNLPSNIITIPIDENYKNNAKVTFINDEHYANYHHIDYLNQQIKMLQHALNSMYPHVTHKEGLFKLIDDTTMIKLSISEKFNGKSLKYEPEMIIENPVININLLNVLFYYIPEGLYKDYIEESRKLAEVQTNVPFENSVNIGTSYNLSSTNELMAMPSISIYFDEITNVLIDELVVTFPSTLVEKVKLPYQTIVFILNKDTKNLEPNVYEYDLRNQETQLANKITLFNKLINDLDEPKIKQLVKQLYHYEMYLNDVPLYQYAANHIITNEDFELVVKETRSEALSKSVHPKLSPYMVNVTSLQSDKEQMFEVDTNRKIKEVLHSDSTTITRGYQSKSLKIGDELRILLTDDLKEKLQLDDFTIIVDKLDVTTLEKSAYEIRKDYLENQLQMINNAITLAYEAYPSKEAFYQMIHSNNLLTEISIRLWGDTFEEIDVTKPNTTLPSPDFKISIGLDNELMEVLTEEIAIKYREYYPFSQFVTITGPVKEGNLSFDKTESFYPALYRITTIGEPVTIHFSKELVELFDLPHSSINLIYEPIEEAD